jgi:hypothetical protein
LPKDDGAKAAFKDADIIVIPAGIPRTFKLYTAIGYELDGIGLMSKQASPE